MAEEKKATSSTKNGAVIRSCSCQSAFQDAKYGNGQRVHNIGPKSGYNCTVCGKKTA